MRSSLLAVIPERFVQSKSVSVLKIMVLTVMGSLRGELIGRKSVDWYTAVSSSAVLHLGARCVKGSLGSLAQYLNDKKTQALIDYMVDSTVHALDVKARRIGHIC